MWWILKSRAMENCTVTTLISMGSSKMTCPMELAHSSHKNIANLESSIKETFTDRVRNGPLSLGSKASMKMGRELKAISIGMN
jgi:hypothetical protein